MNKRYGKLMQAVIAESKKNSQRSLEPEVTRMVTNCDLSKSSDWNDGNLVRYNDN